MIRKILTAILVGLISIQLGYSQKQNLYFTNAQKIDANRYEGVKGNPMIFKSWTKATMVDDLDTVYYDIPLNYNGLTQEFEIQKSETDFIVLDAKYINRIEVENPNAPNGKQVFKKGLYPNSKKDFVEVVFEGSSKKVFKHFRVRKVKSTINDVGKIVEIENFARSIDYYILENGKSSPLKTKKKALLKELGNEKELEKYIKKEKLNLKYDKDLNKLFAFSESIK